MNSDLAHTNLEQTTHRRLETAFQSAAKARNQGAQTVIIEWVIGRNRLYDTAQYAFEKTSDGVYARVRGLTDAESLMRIHNLALKHGLPFSPTASWARTDGKPVTAPAIGEAL